MVDEPIAIRQKHPDHFQIPSLEVAAGSEFPFPGDPRGGETISVPCDLDVLDGKLRMPIVNPGMNSNHVNPIHVNCTTKK